MYNELYFEIKRLEMESKKKIARKTRLECSFKAFSYINNNIEKISSNHMLSILTIIDNYLLGLEFPKKDIDYSNLEEKTTIEYNKLITNPHFIKIKNEYIENYQKEKEEILYKLETRFIELVNSKKSRFNTNKGFNSFFGEFEEIYYELLSLLNIMKLDINNMYFIKNMLLFMKYYGIDETDLISKSNVKEMLIKYNEKVKKK